jgi:hypothetical protein
MGLRTGIRTLILMVVAAIIPSAAWAQATLSGTVKDVSGAVLPGVTVEAGSTVLTEKPRTAITDATGQYRIEGLSGGYSVTFTLPGFSTLKVDGVDLSSAGVVKMDADMQVNGVAETFIVACGMTVMQGDSKIDPKMPQHPPANAPKPTIRIVPAPACQK